MLLFLIAKSILYSINNILIYMFVIYIIELYAFIFYLL